MKYPNPQSAFNDAVRSMLGTGRVTVFYMYDTGFDYPPWILADRITANQSGLYHRYVFQVGRAFSDKKIKTT
jgi:hypothetical protein